MKFPIVFVLQNIMIDEADDPLLGQPIRQKKMTERMPQSPGPRKRKPGRSNKTVVFVLRKRKPGRSNKTVIFVTCEKKNQVGQTNLSF